MSAASYYHPVGHQDHQDNAAKPYDPHVRPVHLGPIGQSAPLGLPARPHQRKPFHRFVNNAWIWELSCWLFTLACFVGIVAILYSFNGKPVPNWKYGITLPTVVSLISSVATFSLVIPLEEGMGQLKWMWFRQAKPLSDFETINDAAGDPTGSAFLIFKMKGGGIAWIGALLTILVTAISPFIQQIISTDFSVVRKPQAFLPIATSFFNDSLTADIDISLKAAIQGGLLAYGNTTSLFATTPQCPTGNCTWTPYTSLSVCGTCADLTSQLKMPPTNSSGTNYSLPNGIYLWKGNGVAGVSMVVNNTLEQSSLTESGNGPPQSIAFQNHTANGTLFPIADVFVIMGHSTWDGTTGGANDINLGPYAAECLLEFCIQNYTAHSSNGTFFETRVDNPIPFNWGNTTDGRYLLVEQGVNYTYGDDFARALNTYTANTFSGSVAMYNNIGPVSQWPDDLTQAIFTYLNSSSHKLDDMFDNIARSMTLNLRTRPGVQQHGGDALYLEPIVAIRWVWISLPLAVLFLALIFVAVVAIQSRMAGLEPWKTSNIATLFALQQLQSPDIMDHTAENTVVRLRDDGVGGRKLVTVGG